MHEAAKPYQKRYAVYTTRPYRHIEQETGRRRIREAMLDCLSGGRLFEDLDAPIPWAQNMAVLNLMLRPAVP